MFFNFKVHPVENCFTLEIRTIGTSQEESISRKKEGMIRREKAHRYIH